MKIVFVSGSMLGGGAERVISLLSNKFVQLGFKVSIVVVRGTSVYKLDDRIELSPVYQEDEIQTNIVNKIVRRFNFYPKLLKRIKEENPDIVIPVHGGFNGIIVLMAKILGVSIIACEQISFTVGSHSPMRWLERHVVYKFADALVVLTENDYKYYQKFLNHVYLIPNPVSFHSISELNDREKILLAAGRLNSWHHKGFDNLIKVFSELVKKYPDWRLQIAGTGEEGKEYLIELAKRLDVIDQIDFLGFRKDIDYIMGKASIFVMSSRYEGFGMVLLEAMSQGCACISFDCYSGPAEIITHNLDGILVEDQNNKAMAHQLEQLISDDELRNKLAIAGLEKVGQFSIKMISKKWIDLFEEINKKS